MINYDMALGLAIQQMRKERQITEDSLASYLGIHKMDYRDMENGIVEFTDNDIDAIAGFLEVHYEDIHDRRRSIVDGDGIYPDIDML